MDYDPALCEPEFGEFSSFLACAPQPGGVVVDAGDGDDVVNTGALPAAQAITVLAGPGNDVVRGARSPTAARRSTATTATTSSRAARAPTSSTAGPGNDPVLEGQGGADVVRGGAGDDTLRGDKHNDPVSADVLDGGPGFDQIDGDWSVDVGQHQPPIAVSEDGVANDGRPGEGDNVVEPRADLPQPPATLVGDGEDDEYTVFNTDESPEQPVRRRRERQAQRVRLRRHGRRRRRQRHADRAQPPNRSTTFASVLTTP